MIDVYAPRYVPDKQAGAPLGGAVMAVEEVPDIAIFRQNTAAFIHDLPADAISTSTAVRIVRVQC
jgi:hypothetical protein